MNHRRFPSSLFPLPIILVLQVMLGIPQSLGSPEMFEKCRDARFNCGSIHVGYPFSGDGIPPGCGHPDLLLDCKNDIATIEIVGVRYQVREIQWDRQTIRIARQDLIENGLCNPKIRNSTLDYKLFDLVNAPDYVNATMLYGCKNMFSERFDSCGLNSTVYKHFWIQIQGEDIASVQCSANFTFPILRSSREGRLDFTWFLENLQNGFELEWKLNSPVYRKCIDTGGACGINSTNQTICYCRDNFGWQEMEGCFPQHQGKREKGVRLLLGLTVSVTTAILVVCTICCIVRFKREPSSITKLGNNNASVEEFITKFRSLGPKRYFYTDIKKMTNKFKDKLGQGGYGSVYKGKLSDGRLVAVKVLSESKGNGEDFMNEVASISRTSHVNIVALLGFCYDRSKRALVYEFIPRGSLDKFIYNQGSQDQSRQLEWKTLYDIALGIARGLEYLHQGCSTRILHFDIKPHNILLDENFCPKISDFGLSKLCERKESIISMTGARGTVGFIAPEVFCRNFGGVSHKSDVYSYGMMVLEMVGGRKNIDVEVSQTSEIYFPSWIYKHIDDQVMNLSLDGVISEVEEVMRRLTVVSLWCIQTNPRDRPSMTKVLEMLQGSLQSLEIPPRPFVSSPIRSPKTSSTTLM